MRHEHAEGGERPQAVEPGEPAAGRPQAAGRVGRSVLGRAPGVGAALAAIDLVAGLGGRRVGDRGRADGASLGVPRVPPAAGAPEGGVEGHGGRHHQRQLGGQPEPRVAVHQRHDHDHAAHHGHDREDRAARPGAARSGRCRPPRRCRTRPPCRPGRARSPSGRPTCRAAAAPAAGTGRRSARPGLPPRRAPGRRARGRSRRRSRGSPCPAPRRRPRAPGARSPGCRPATSSRPGRPRRPSRSWRCRWSGRAGPTAWSAPRSGTGCTRPTGRRRRPPPGRPRPAGAPTPTRPRTGPPARAPRWRHHTRGTASRGPSRIDSDRTRAATPITTPKVSALRSVGRSHQRYVAHRIAAVVATIIDSDTTMASK